MYVHDAMYYGDVRSLSPATTALFEVVDKVCRLTGSSRPSRVVTAMVIRKMGVPLLAIDLIDVMTSRDDLPTWRAYAVEPAEIVSALEQLAPYGCRGNELGFVCGVSPDGNSCHWAFADLVTMEPKILNGSIVRSDDYRW